MMLHVLQALHMLGAVLWVGGMYFVLFVLRPSLPQLEPASERPKLMRRVAGRFFPMVALSIIVILVTGHLMIETRFGGFEGLPLYIHLMMGLGWLMVILFAYLYRWPWGDFRRAVDQGDLESAPRHLERIRHIILVNLVLGVIVVAIAATGRYWG